MVPGELVPLLGTKGLGTRPRPTTRVPRVSVPGSGTNTLGTKEKMFSIDSYHRTHDGVRNPSGSSRKYSLCQLNYFSCALPRSHPVCYCVL
jgi:hypothetical protein